MGEPPQPIPPDLMLRPHPALREHPVPDVRGLSSFPTALLAEYIRDEAHRTTAVAVYSGTLAVTAVLFTLLWLYAANYRLIDQSVDPVLLRAMTRRYVLGMLLYIVAFALAFVSPAASLVLIVILALIFVLPEPNGSNSARQHFFEG